MILKKNQALQGSLSSMPNETVEQNTQFANDPLHHAKVIHHLDERNEEDDRGKLVHAFMSDLERL
jgi:hypothetical protein